MRLSYSRYLDQYFARFMFAFEVACRFLSRRRMERALSVAGALAFHFVVLLMLLAPAGRGVYGRPGSSVGTAVEVSLVVGLDDSDGQGASLKQATAVPEPKRQNESLTDVAEARDFEQAVSETSTATPNVEASPQSSPKTQLAAASVSETPMAYGGEGGGGRPSSGGDPNAATAVLEQIARCLQADERPNLGSRSLAVSFDATGRLRAAPEMSGAAPWAGAEERAVADRIVQAALLCGPYEAAGVAGHDLTLIPDFSGIATRLAAGIGRRD